MALCFCCLGGGASFLDCLGAGMFFVVWALTHRPAWLDFEEPNNNKDQTAKKKNGFPPVNPLSQPLSGSLRTKPPEDVI